MNKKLVAAIDFGNDKLSIAIAYKNMDNSLELIDFWSKPLVDVSRNGILQNPNNVLMEINYYFQQAEQANNIKIGTYYFGLEPHTLRSDIKAVACRSNGDIATSIKQLEDEISHNYAVDNRRVLLNKMLSLTQGANVQGDFLSVSVADRVKNSIDKITSNLSTERKMKFMVSPMVEADAFLSDIQRQNGVLFIDFGAEVTSFAVYKDGLPRLVSVLPIGGKHVTQDIACRFLIDVGVAERLKVELGVAAAEFVTEDKSYSIKETAVKLSLRELAATIEARLCEMMDFIVRDIDDRGLGSAYETIVIAGGASNMQYLPELLGKQTDREIVRLSHNILQHDNKFLDNTLLMAMLKQIDEDCKGVVVQRPVEQPIVQHHSTTPKQEPKARRKSFWDKFSGMQGMFDEDSEKSL